MARKQKDPSKLRDLSQYDFDGKISDIIKELQLIVKQHPNATIKCELDWGVCYYEGDIPSVIFKVTSK